MEDNLHDSVHGRKVGRHIFKVERRQNTSQAVAFARLKSIRHYKPGDWVMKENSEQTESVLKCTILNNSQYLAHVP